jgi:hypothetical protein
MAVVHNHLIHRRKEAAVAVAELHITLAMSWANKHQHALPKKIPYVANGGGPFNRQFESFAAAVNLLSNHSVTVKSRFPRSYS